MYSRRIFLGCVTLLLLLNTACTQAARSPAVPSTPALSTGAATPAPAQPRQSPTPALVPSLVSGPPVGTQPGADWLTYQDAADGIQFAYPPNWQAGAEGQVSGPDGYAWLETRPNDGSGPGAVCQGEANRDKLGRYGSTPEIRDLQDTPPTCLILPSSDQPAEQRTAALAI